MISVILSAAVANVLTAKARAVVASAKVSVVAKAGAFGAGSMGLVVVATGWLDWEGAMLAR